MNRWKIRTRLALAVAAPLVGLVLFSALAFATIDTVRIKGPNYARIDEAKDLVADVRTGPLSVVDVYLTALQLTNADQATEQELLFGRLDRQRQAYDTARARWEAELGDPALRAALEDAHARAGRFFTALVDEFLPAVRTGNLDLARNLAETRLQPLYEEQRSAIDVTVAAATAQERRVEGDTAVLVSSRTLLLLLVFLAALIASALLGFAVSRSLIQPIRLLRRSATVELPRVVRELRTSDLEQTRAMDKVRVQVDTDDELAEAATAFNQVMGTAIELASEQARLRRATAETFVQLAHRNQALVQRQLKLIDRLERDETDPELLADLFRLDHLATRMRRNAESLMVLAGVEPTRTWREPLAVHDVVRAAVAEVEAYERVELGPFDDGVVDGAAAADVIHLLAELVENALRWSPADAPVAVRGRWDGDRYVLGVADRGPGLTPAELEALNGRLRAAPSGELAGGAPAAGGLGLTVVGRLAARHGIGVELETRTGGAGAEGVTAWVALPAQVVAEPPATPAPDATAAAATEPAAVPRPASPPAPTPTPTPTPAPAPTSARTPAPAPPAAVPAGVGTPVGGLRRRVPGASAGLAANEPPAPTLPRPPVPDEAPRSATEVRARLDRFSAGKRRAGARTEPAPAPAPPPPSPGAPAGPPAGAPAAPTVPPPPPPPPPPPRRVVPPPPPATGEPHA